MSNSMLKEINEREPIAENNQITFDENDFFGSMQRLIEAVNNHQPTKEEEYDFQYSLAMLKGSKNEVKATENLYKIIQAKRYNLLTEDESDKFVLHPDCRINVV